MKRIIILLVFLTGLVKAQNREFPGHVLSVYDGDTYTIDIDLGFSLMYQTNIRMYGLDCPEMRGLERAQGIEVRDSVRTMILDKPVLIELVKERGKYGRPIVILYREEDMLNLNQWLIDNGLCKEKDY